MSRALLLLGLLLLAARPPAAAGQLDNPAPVDETEVRLELAKPFLEGDFGFSTAILRGRVLVPLREGTSLIVGAGIAHATFGDAPSSQTLSNPVVGLVYGDRDGFQGHVTLHLPLAREFGDDDYATGVGIVTFYQGFEEWLPDVVTLGAGGTFRRSLDSGGNVGVRVGARLMIPTGDLEGDPELFPLSGAFVELPAGEADVRLEVSGQALLTESDLSLGQRTVFGAEASVTLPGRIGPEIFLGVPLDGGARASLDAVLGVRVTL